MHNILRLVYDRNEIVPGDDGYFVYWPVSGSFQHADGACTAGGGAYSATVLRTIADELDRVNAGWDKEIQEYFNARRTDT